MITLPQNLQWVQTNRSDILGNLQGTFNVDLTRILGKVKVNRTITTTTGLNNFPVGFKQLGTFGLFTVAGNKTYIASPGYLQTPFTQEVTSGNPTATTSLQSDIETFLGNLYVTAVNDGGNDTLYKFTGTVWSHVTLATQSTGPHMMTVFNSRLYITVAASSKVYSTSDGTTIVSPSSANALALDANLNPVCIRGSSNRLWIGCLAINGRGSVIEWDGVATTYTREYKLQAQGALACVIKDDIPWVIDTNGRLLTFSNGAFIEKARFPVNNKLLLSSLATNNSRWIHPNGMVVVNDKINILINNILDDNSSINEFCAAGIWEYDDKIGLYHKYPLSYLPVGTNTITDYGQTRISAAGGLAALKPDDATAAQTGDFLAGATIYTNASSTSSCVFTNDTFTALSGTTGQYNTLGHGYLVTSKIYASGIQDTWNNVFTLYKSLQSSSDKIQVKYRVSDSPPTEYSIIWTSTSTFTTTTNILGLEGYEVEVIQGTGSGYVAHITLISVTGGTYTVTLDDTFTGASGTAKIRVQNWKKFISTTSSRIDTYDQGGIEVQSNWCQLKICMLMTSMDELERIKITNTPKVLAI